MASLNSVNVAPGQLTLADQYNNLRLDIIRKFPGILGEDISQNDLCRIIDNAGTPNFKKIVSSSGLSFGAEYVFNSANTQLNVVVKLDSTRALICYKNNADTQGKCVVATISGSNISYGSIYTFNAGSVISISAEKVDTDKVIICYSDNSNSNFGTAIIATISGTVVSFGAEYVYKNIDTSDYGINIGVLSTTSVFIGYGNQGLCKICTITGTVLAFGTEYDTDPSTALLLGIAVLSPTSVLINYRDFNNYGACKVATIAGTVITFTGVKYNYTATNLAVTTGGNRWVGLIDSTHVIIVYAKNNGSGVFYGNAVIATIAGTVVTFGAEYQFNPANTYGLSVEIVDTTHAFICYDDFGNSTYGTVILATIAGTVVSYGIEYIFNAGTTGFPSMKMLSSGSFLIAFQDVSNSNFGTAIMLLSQIVYNADYTAIAQETGLNGETKKFVLLGGISSSHVGLTPGTIYYIQSDGTIGTTNAGLGSVGRAISSTEMLLDKNP